MPNSTKAPSASHAKVGTAAITRHALTRFRERALTVQARLPDEQLLNRLKSSFGRARLLNMPQSVAIRRLRKHQNSTVYLEDLEEGVWFVVAILRGSPAIITVEPAKDRKTGENLFKK